MNSASPPPVLARPWRRELRWLLPLGVLLLALAYGVFTREQRALERMEPAARSALFEKTWASFLALCPPNADPALDEQCQTQARFLLRFPECQDTCRARLVSVTQGGR